MRLGIYGGSFDPVHNAHLAVARECQRAARLDEVWFVPTAVQPLKQSGPQASNEDRIEMLRLATADEPTWRICTIEIARGGVSYTIDTLRQISAELPDTELFFLMGGDSLRDVPQWREPAAIFHLATPLVVHRAGQPEPDLATLQLYCPAERPPRQVEFPAMEISSSEIRRRAAASEPIDRMVPAAVRSYIDDRGLYRPIR